MGGGGITLPGVWFQGKLPTNEPKDIKKSDFAKKKVFAISIITILGLCITINNKQQGRKRL